MKRRKFLKNVSLAGIGLVGSALIGNNTEAKTPKPIISRNKVKYAKATGCINKKIGNIEVKPIERLEYVRGQEKHHVAYTIPNHGRIPERHVDYTSTQYCSDPPSCGNFLSYPGYN